MGPGSLIVLIAAAVAFSAGGIMVAKIFVKGSKNAQKGEAYECGVPTHGSPWNQFNVGYYLFALIFLIFDGAGVSLSVGCGGEKYWLVSIHRNNHFHFHTLHRIFVCT